MSNSPAWQFYPKQWLGDDHVLLMDWDARGMHVHLMCIAWQQDPPCSLPDNDSALRKWCGNPKRWRKVKDQILSAWKLIGGRWVQEGLLREYEKQRQYSQSRRQAAEVRWGKKPCTRNAHALHTECSSSSSSSSKKNKTGAALSSDSLTAFETFWNCYPKKKNKGQAEKAWADLKPDNALAGLMLKTLEQARVTPEWKKDGGKFIPYPATWLRAKGWLDEVATPKPERIPL